MAEAFTADELERLRQRADELATDNETDAGLRAALQLFAEAAGNLAIKLPTRS